MEMPKNATEALERILAEKEAQESAKIPLDKDIQENKRPTEEKIRAFIQQFSREEKLLLIAFLRLLHAERDTEKAS